MRISAMLLAAALTAASGMVSAAHAVVVNISGTGQGCAQCFGGPTVPAIQPGQTVNLVGSLLTLPFTAGTYTITNGDTSGAFSGWNYNVFSPPNAWVWSFIIGEYLGGDLAKILMTGWINAPGTTTQAAVPGQAGASMNGNTVINPSTTVADWMATLTLPTNMTLAFFIVDGGLGDNAGGVSLNMVSPTAVPLPAALPLLGAALGLFGWMGRRRMQSDRTA